ncbi:MAG: hypothetical protein HXY40_08880 [Chloroflexi bacterium]|nr:hypothetical protein [Chloroflexota bacterium]
MTSVDGARLAARLVNCLPAATFEMETLSRLAGIETSRKIPTAAVECLSRPRLLLNPDFVAKYCQRDEHLFLLVMHELWHILLAHTRLYTRVTQAHNIAFDAIINAGLCRQFNGPDYQGFFEALNAPDKFPHILLRPPLGWPTDPQYPEDIGPAGTREILERLYPPLGARWAPPFYEEILALLRQYMREQGMEWAWLDGEPFLLGDHDDSEAEKALWGNPMFSGVMQRVVSSWPNMPYMPGRGRGTSMIVNEWQNQRQDVAEDTRRAFASVLRKTLTRRPGQQRRRTRQPTPGVSGTSVLPNARDRMMPARRMLGGPDTLWNQQGQIKARVPETPSRSFMYLDVSGSMANVLPYLLGLVVPYVQQGVVEVFQFSTVVEPLPGAQLRQNKLRTTGGTDINCVLRHLLEVRPPVQRVLILTDGFVGQPQYELAAGVRERGIRLYVVLPAESANLGDLEALAKSMTVLPPLRGRW